MSAQPFTVIVNDERDRLLAVRAVERAPYGRQVKVSRPTRTNDQNARLHALLTDIAAQLPWPKDTGELHEVEWWKRTCTLTWLHEINAHPEIIMSLDGNHMGLLIPHTSDLDVEKAASLNIWIEAFGVTNGVAFKPPKNGPEPPPPESDR